MTTKAQHDSAFLRTGLASFGILLGERPSIAELQRTWSEILAVEEQGLGSGLLTPPIFEAAPVLLEIAAVALVRRDTECSCGAELGCFPDCEREIAERALLEALAKVRP